MPPRPAQTSPKTPGIRTRASNSRRGRNLHRPRKSLRVAAGGRVGVPVYTCVLSEHARFGIRLGNALLSMFVKVRNLVDAWFVFGKMEERNVFSWNVLVGGYAKGGYFDEALNLYHRMLWAGVKPDVYTMELEGVMPDEVAIFSVLSACASLGFLDMGIKLHELAKRTGLVSYIIVANALIDLYSKCKCIDRALEVFLRIPRKDVISWTSIIIGLRINNRSLEALAFFRQMKLSLNPNYVTLVSALSACGRIGALMCGKEIHAHALRMGSGFDGILPNAILDMYVRCGRMGPASNLFNTHEKDIFSWNILLMGYAQQGQGLLAAELFDRMTKSAVEPDEITFTNLLRACSRIHRQSELGEIAAQHILEMDELSVGYYTLLCNFYGGDGRWDEVARFRKMMRDKGLTVDPACSWVEVKGTVHAFLSGDDSHPQIQKINAVLEGFYEKMKETGGVGTESSSRNGVEDSKAEVFCGHSERKAIAFGLINTVPGMPISVTKNLYMCESCHNTVKFISKVVRREISVRDTQNFHNFKDGVCSCGDEGYWGKT
ncbi:hypothetical protein C3L33_00305, partial [Rhododendron williamsianum]